jgi:predicted nucleic acid-binding protein
MKPLFDGSGKIFLWFVQQAIPDSDQLRFSLLPISLDILRESANVRVTQNLKTQDAIHAATAFLANCDYLLQ